MATDSLIVYKTDNDRYRSAKYQKDGGENFCIVEKTGNGVLVTEFTEHGVVTDQAYHKVNDPETVINEYLSPVGKVELRITDVYEKVYSKKQCKQCNGSVVRELDLKDPKTITNVPVVPLFVCVKCSKRYYSMSNRYLMHLVSSNQDLFDEKDLKDKEKDIDAFINTLNEYIIRIFASKKISRLD
jgi:hypothetical protein